ncbi:ferric reductase-like transmembrane domain-containing protein [Actinocrispum sp. NPDC049592]|uniref:ferric reductase-like transmembrane domain-containing protein n=1 Tax=Actinocrispum sp. NPDC049592 TaxID=3154835 RepID=UPI00342DC737
MTLAAPFVGESTLWYLARGSGIVSLALFTMTVVLGLLVAGRLSSPAWPRFVTETLHRNLSLASVLFLAVHIVTIVSDNFVTISLVDAFVPFAGSYSPFYLGLGALSVDIILALVLTSLFRTRLPFKAWRFVHWLAYLSWPVAVVHTIGIGSDQSWVLITVGISVVLVLAAGSFRVASVRRRAS